MRRILLALLILTPFAAHAETTYERVLRTGTIRCGYYSWPPMLAKDINSGQMSGSLVEIMGEVAKRLSLKIEWTEEAPLTTYVEGIQSGRYDLGCGPLYVIGSRARIVHFTSALFYSPVQMAVRIDDARFSSNKTSILNDPSFTIAVQEGEAGALIVSQKLPQAKIDAIPPMSDYAQMFQEVMSGKADATAVAPLAFLNFDKANPGKLRLLPEPVSYSAVAYGVPNNDFAFASMIDGAVREIVDDGTVADIFRRHGELAALPVPVPTLQRE